MEKLLPELSFSESRVYRILMSSLTPLPLADRYSRFCDAVFSGLEEPSPALLVSAPLNELDLQSLWFAGAFGHEFTSAAGKGVKIIDFGLWNSGAGPDFTECTVQIDGATHHGEIELDPDARDWERHAHGANVDYRRVVLHVFLQSPEQRFFTRTVEHKEVAQVQISLAMLAQDARPNRSQAAARLGRCATPLREMEDSRVQSILESAAQYRLERKSKRLHRAVAAHGREQAIFQALAQTLGYRNNQQPFLLLSQRLPLKRLKKRPHAEREALLFGISGFMENVRFEDTQPATREYLRQIWQDWWRLRDGCQRWLTAAQLPHWKLAATRPGNHPQRRLGALAAMLAVWEGISAPLMDAGRWSQPSWREALLKLRHDYWANHYTLLAEPAAKPIALIGETRVQEMLANVAYPLLMPERTRLWAEYLELPAMLDNQKLRIAALRLFGDHPRSAEFQKKLHHQQGLLQLYEDFCLEDDSACANCPFPERLKEWR
jgi:Protein of unknown function (DUF2851)